MRNVVVAKLGSMRKAREWSVMPLSDGRILVQTYGAIGAFDFRTDEGQLFNRGGYFPHLAIALSFTFPPEFVRACLAVCPSLGGQTVTCDGALVVEHTAHMIGEATR